VLSLERIGRDERGIAFTLSPWLQSPHELSKMFSYTGASKLRSQSHHVSQPVLNVMQLGLLDQPLPIQVWEVQREPRQRLDHTGWEFVLAQRREQHCRWIEQPPL
jgi:hypothetical protein